jgi:hypothetical protein
LVAERFAINQLQACRFQLFVEIIFIERRNASPNGTALLIDRFILITLNNDLLKSPLRTIKTVTHEKINETG